MKHHRPLTPFFLQQHIIYTFLVLLTDDIVKTSSNQNVIVKKLDLSSQRSIREFAADILKSESRLDVLIHNAGTAESKTRVTEDGLELTMATNHFGPFLLTHLLIGMGNFWVLFVRKKKTFFFVFRSFKTHCPKSGGCGGLRALPTCLA